VTLVSKSFTYRWAVQILRIRFEQVVFILICIDDKVNIAIFGSFNIKG